MMKATHYGWSMETLAYGPGESHVGDLFLPGRVNPPVVCLLHGGFWKMPYDRAQLTPVSEDLASGGFAVWNIEYRRVDAEGGGWHGTFDDIVSAMGYLGVIKENGRDLDLGRIIIAGHSAGGHLALWYAAQCRRESRPFGKSTVVPVAAVGLAPVVDLAGAHEVASGGDSVAKLLGGTPLSVPERYDVTSPMAMLPLGIRQLVIHGVLDEALPIELSRKYVRAARKAGDEIDFIELASAGHMDFLDPSSGAHAEFRAWLAEN